MAASHQITVYGGPSLSHHLRRKIDAETIVLRSPLSQGDLLRPAYQCEPQILVLIDGYFHDMPAVWHKEILLALSHGHRVIGAASMGAQRAADLHSFGMQGVGKIFSWFSSGQLIDDADVALLHGPAPSYAPCTLSIADLYALISETPLLGPIHGDALLNELRAVYFGHRTLERVLQVISRFEKDHHIPLADLVVACRQLMAGDLPSQKQRDAEAAVTAALDLRASLLQDRQVAGFTGSWTLAHTVMLEGLINRDAGVFLEAGFHPLLNTKKQLLSHALLSDPDGYALVESQAVVIRLAALIFDLTHAALDQGAYTAFRSQQLAAMEERGELSDGWHCRGLTPRELDAQLLAMFKAAQVVPALSRFAPNDDLTAAVYRYLATADPAHPAFERFELFNRQCLDLSTSMLHEIGESSGRLIPSGTLDRVRRAYGQLRNPAGLISGHFQKGLDVVMMAKLLHGVGQRALASIQRTLGLGSLP